MILFISIFLLLYSGVHYYVYQKTKAAFALSREQNIALVLFLSIMVCIPIMTRFAARYGFESLARLSAFIGYT